MSFQYVFALPERPEKRQCALENRYFMLFQNFSGKVEHGRVVKSNEAAIGALLVVNTSGLRLQVVAAKKVTHRINVYAE